MAEWFRDLTGTHDDSRRSVHRHLRVEGEDIVSDLTGRRMRAGRLHMPSLGELRQAGRDRDAPAQVAEVVADIRALHADPANAGAVFQVASQYNLLEMVGPDVTPEDGIARYVHDRTQGPACAMCCGAGTLYRNYFVPLDGEMGQTAGCQLDMAEGLHTAMGGGLWDMRNGYLLPRPGGLSKAAARLAPGMDDALRIGVQAGTEVTLAGAGHPVTQVYCSAAPVAYHGAPVANWAPLAQAILNAAYEATLAVALDTGAKVFLTRLGGGAFGNPAEWIDAAILRALRLFARSGLEVILVSYGGPSGLEPRMQAAVAGL